VVPWPVKMIQGEPDRIRASLQHGSPAPPAVAMVDGDRRRAIGGRSFFGPGVLPRLDDEDAIVRNWWAVAPSSTKQQIEPEQIGSAQEAVPLGKTARLDIVSAGILILAGLGIVYTLYFGKEILLPIALALVLKLLLQPAMRLLHDRLRLPGALDQNPRVSISER